MDYTCIPKKGCSLFVISLGVFVRDLGEFINIPANSALGAGGFALQGHPSAISRQPQQPATGNRQSQWQCSSTAVPGLAVVVRC